MLLSWNWKKRHNSMNGLSSGHGCSRRLLHANMDGMELLEEEESVAVQAVTALVDVLTATLMPVSSEDEQLQEEVQQQPVQNLTVSMNAVREHFVYVLQHAGLCGEMLLRTLLQLPWGTHFSQLPSAVLSITTLLSDIATEHPDYIYFVHALVFRIISQFQFCLQRVKSLIAEDTVHKSRSFVCKITSYSMWMQLYEHLLKVAPTTLDIESTQSQLLDSAIADYLALLPQCSTSILSGHLFSACKLFELHCLHRPETTQNIDQLKQLLHIAYIVSEQHKTVRDQLSFRQFLTLPVPGSEFVLVNLNSSDASSWDTRIKAKSKTKLERSVLRDVFFWNEKVMSAGAKIHGEEEGVDSQPVEEEAALTAVEQQLHCLVKEFNQWNESLQKHQYNLKDVVWSCAQHTIVAVAEQTRLPLKLHLKADPRTPSKLEHYAIQLLKSFREFAISRSASIIKRLRKVDDIFVQVPLVFQFLLVSSDVYATHKLLDAPLRALLLEIDMERQVYRDLLLVLSTRVMAIGALILGDFMQSFEQYLAHRYAEETDVEPLSSGNVLALVFQVNIFQLMLAHGNALVFSSQVVLNTVQRLVAMMATLCQQNHAILPTALEQYFLTLDEASDKAAKKKQRKEIIALSLESYLQKHLLVMGFYVVFHRVADIVADRDADVEEDEEDGVVLLSKQLRSQTKNLVTQHTGLLYAWLPYQYTLVILLFLLPLLHGDEIRLDDVSDVSDVSDDTSEDEGSVSSDENSNNESAVRSVVMEVKDSIVSLDIHRVFNVQSAAVQAFAVDGLSLLQPTAVCHPQLTAFTLYYSPWLSALPLDDFPNLHAFSSQDLVALHEKCLVPYMNQSLHSDGGNGAENRTSKKALLCNLPTELICHIFSFVNYKRIVSKLSLVSSYFADLLRQPNLMLWEDVYFRSFPKAVFLETHITPEQKRQLLMKIHKKAQSLSNTTVAKKRKRHEDDSTEIVESKFCLVCFAGNSPDVLQTARSSLPVSLCVSRQTIHDYRGLFQRKVECLQRARKMFTKFRLCNMVGCECVIRGGKKEEEAHFSKHLRAFNKQKQAEERKPTAEDSDVRNTNNNI